VTSAIAAKLEQGRTRAGAGDLVGGSTLRFQLEPGHPYEAQVLGLLTRTRQQLDAFWQQVSDYNDAHPIPPERRIDVWFYYGQGVASLDSGDAEASTLE
jgi:hypothetical protein